MRRIAFAVIGAALAGGALGAAGAQASEYGYDVYDGPRTVVTRRTVIERRVVVPPREVMREVVIERPVVPPRRVVREIIVERDGFDGPRRFGPRPVGYSYRPHFDPYD